jgi:hypothetical protein
MNLKSFGCSFIFGSELADAIVENRILASNSTWPAHIAQHLGYNYCCYAKPGSGNLQILEQVLAQAADSKNNDLFVISWTWIDRFDYYNSSLKGNKWNNWLTIGPNDENTLAKIYYQDLHSEYKDKFTTLLYIRLAVDTLQQKNIPFVMTYTDELLFEQQWHTTPAVLELQNYIQPHMNLFEDHTFLDWSRKNNYPIGKAWHPLEKAHAAAADYMIKVFDKQKTNALAQ